MSGPLFFQLFVYVVFLALNLLQLDNVSAFQPYLPMQTLNQFK